MLISEILCTLEMKPIPAFLGGTAPKPGKAKRRGHERIDRVQFKIGERLGLNILKAKTHFYWYDQLHFRASSGTSQGFRVKNTKIDNFFI